MTTPKRMAGEGARPGAATRTLSGRRKRSVYRVNAAASSPPAATKGKPMRGTRPSIWINVICRAACGLLVSLTAACSGSDETPPGPTSPTPTAPQTPTGGGERVHLSGRVLNQNGIPVSGALVEVDYAPAG